MSALSPDKIDPHSINVDFRCHNERDTHRGALMNRLVAALLVTLSSQLADTQLLAQWAGPYERLDMIYLASGNGCLSQEAFANGDSHEPSNLHQERRRVDAFPGQS